MAIKRKRADPPQHFELEAVEPTPSQTAPFVAYFASGFCPSEAAPCSWTVHSGAEGKHALTGRLVRAFSRPA